MRLLIACAFASLVFPEAVFAYSVRLDAARCTNLPLGQVAALGPDWSELAPYVQRCAISGPDGRPALTVDIVRLDQAYAAHFFNKDPDRKVPNRVLRDVTGRAVGNLPEGFPVDPPGALRVTFAGWSGGRPLRVELYEAGRSAVSSQQLPPLYWDSSKNAYQ